MLTIPTKRPAGRFVGLPNGPQHLAAMLWGDSTSPETIQKRALEWMKETGEPIRHATPAYEAIASGAGNTPA